MLVKAPADGYTDLMADYGSTTITVLMHGKAAIDLQRDFTPVTIVAYSPDVKDKLAVQGAEPLGSTPAEAAEFTRRERERMGKLIRDNAGKNQ